jgi:hypothetical protein
VSFGIRDATLVGYGGVSRIHVKDQEHLVRQIMNCYGMRLINCMTINNAIAVLPEGGRVLQECLHYLSSPGLGVLMAGGVLAITDASSEERFPA